MKATKDPENHRNSGTLPGPKGFVYQRPYRMLNSASAVLELRGLHGPGPNRPKTVGPPGEMASGAGPQNPPNAL